MNSNLFNALMSLQSQISDCGCVERNESCPACDVAMSALIELEKHPRLAIMSESIERNLCESVVPEFDRIPQL